MSVYLQRIEERREAPRWDGSALRCCHLALAQEEGGQEPQRQWTAVEQGEQAAALVTARQSLRVRDGTA